MLAAASGMDADLLIFGNILFDYAKAVHCSVAAQ